jgi:hypothetical protein
MAFTENERPLEQQVMCLLRFALINLFNFYGLRRFLEGISVNFHACAAWL